MPIDYTRYPPDWKQRVARVRIRDKFQCTRCKVEEWTEYQRPLPGSMVLPLRRVILTTAHLDHDEENWEVTDDRLATMCPGCHLRYDHADNQMRKAYGRNYRQTIIPIPFPHHDQKKETPHGAVPKSMGRSSGPTPGKTTRPG